MGEEPKKISFGFNKFIKKTQIISAHVNQGKSDKNKVELIDCLEGKSIKLKDHVDSEDKVLVIPLKRKQDISSEGLKPGAVNNITLTHLSNSTNNQGTLNEACELKSNGNENQSGLNSTDSVPKPLTIDEIAAREILEDLNSKKTQEESRIFAVPLTNNPPAGEKESSLEDYDNIPVTDFGLAMLRGMGWAPGKGIGKNEKLITPSLPTLRPKGMGLGADKFIKTEVAAKTNAEDVKMTKGSFVRVIAGPHKNCYGEIEGFDDEAGRLIVKLALKNVTLSLNEFMVHLVDKVEFSKNSKVINVAKYEQYKDNESKINTVSAQGFEPDEESSSSDKHDKHNKTGKQTKTSRAQSNPSESKPYNQYQEKSSNKFDHYSKSEDKFSKIRQKEGSKSPRRKSETRCYRPSSSEREFSNREWSVLFKERGSPSEKSRDRHSNKKKTRSSSGSSEESNRRRSRKSRSSHTAYSSGRGDKNTSRRERHCETESVRKHRTSSCSSYNSSESSDYSRKKYKKKKCKSRSRSRSPRKHKKSKKNNSR